MTSDGQARYCLDKAVPEGSSVYYASLFHGREERRGLAALLALYYELLGSVTGVSDPGVLRIKLQWWREELARLEQGRPRHPVSRELRRLLELERLPSAAPLLALPDSVEALFCLAPPDQDGWPECRAIGDLWVSAAGAGPEASAGQISALAGTGIALARLEVLQNVRHLARLGFNPLPTDRLRQFEVHDRDLQGQSESGRVRELFAALTGEIEDSLRRHYAGFPRASLVRQPFAPIMNRIGAATCREIRGDGCRLLSHKVALTPIRKFRIAVAVRYLGRFL